MDVQRRKFPIDVAQPDPDIFAPTGDLRTL